jgi:hypothetical protein
MSEMVPAIDLTQLQLIMPNMAEDPSDTHRFALHRLVGLLISLVGTPKDRITLYEQVRSRSPFDETYTHNPLSSCHPKTPFLPSD